MEEYTTCIPSDLKQGLQKCSLDREPPIINSAPHQLFACAARAISVLLQGHTPVTFVCVMRRNIVKVELQQASEKSDVTVIGPDVRAGPAYRDQIVMRSLRLVECQLMCAWWGTTRLAPRRNGDRFPAGSLPDFRAFESCRTMLLVNGFSWGSPVSPSPLRSGAAPYSPCFTLIGSQDVAVKGRPNVSPPLHSNGGGTAELSRRAGQSCKNGWGKTKQHSRNSLDSTAFRQEVKPICDRGNRTLSISPLNSAPAECWLESWRRTSAGAAGLLHRRLFVPPPSHPRVTRGLMLEFSVACE
ncbi:hypothetical protein PR048_022849 [Dryococelus australis]|uniref:Uncharacterized protein n=1 Tax=Dryococelus australis TaxID=614101 RepID=A0ABQ9GSI6_9NEOP|nr:hypothetical protein PR048_022849 [Dryococelus australis]